MAENETPVCVMFYCHCYVTSPVFKYSRSHFVFKYPDFLFVSKFEKKLCIHTDFNRRNPFDRVRENWFPFDYLPTDWLLMLHISTVMCTNPESSQ